MNPSETRELVAGFDSVLQDSISIETALEISQNIVWPDQLRQTLSSIGFFDLALSESDGGLGLNLRTLASLSVATGYRLLPTSLLFESLVLAPTLAAAGLERADQLENLRRGSLGGGGCVLDRLAEESTAGIDLNISMSPDAVTAAVLSPGGATLVNLDDTRVILVEPVDRMSKRAAVDPTNGAQIQVPDSLRHTWLIGSLADCVGAASAALDRATDYARQRQQFGRPISQFQAISHLLANMKANVELSLASLSRLIYLAETDDDGYQRFLTSLLHAIPARMRSVCEGAIQVHGGMGFTWEAGLHLFYRRVLQTQAHLGGSRETARSVGALAFSG